MGFLDGFRTADSTPTTRLLKEYERGEHLCGRMESSITILEEPLSDAEYSNGLRGIPAEEIKTKMKNVAWLYREVVMDEKLLLSQAKKIFEDLSDLPSREQKYHINRLTSDLRKGNDRVETLLKKAEEIFTLLGRRPPV